MIQYRSFDDSISILFLTLPRYWVYCLLDQFWILQFTRKLFFLILLCFSLFRFLSAGLSPLHFL
ncbi:hypothetical protein CN975_24105 [Bacillus cereus]|nr:hypothetical protein CN477_08115 [Bacillus cereus]PFB99158.1 hypothetical protein CN280_25545 [Bacillus cereus]PFF08630.1 hypothetical protein CN343_28300 [Bacillus cereus]PFK24009.1 hypothetical protein COJ03_09275 [Bacillus cereus]PGK16540.1 hypothetical protein CN895_05795 [Bacillus cereus]